MHPELNGSINDRSNFFRITALSRGKINAGLTRVRGFPLRRNRIPGAPASINGSGFIRLRGLPSAYRPPAFLEDRPVHIALADDAHELFALYDGDSTDLPEGHEGNEPEGISRGGAVMTSRTMIDSAGRSPMSLTFLPIRFPWGEDFL